MVTTRRLLLPKHFLPYYKISYNGLLYINMSVCESSRAKLSCVLKNAPKAKFYGPTYPTHFQRKIITIHHERPCRIEISHPRGRKFNQGRGLPSPWLNSDPEGEISLSYIDRLMMDRFSPFFRRVFVRT